MHIGHNPLQLERKDTFVLNILLCLTLLEMLMEIHCYIEILTDNNIPNFSFGLLSGYLKQFFQTNTKYFNEDPNINVLWILFHEVILFERICVRVIRFDVNTLKDINIF